MNKDEYLEHECISDEDEYYSDWFSDHADSLRRDFAEEQFPDEFHKYCKEQFNDWGKNDD
jgi:hypothetical protein